MSDTLAEICRIKRDHVDAVKSLRPASQLRASLEGMAAPRPFYKALYNKHARGEAALIAELKKASPSKGLIRKDFDVPTLAKAYAEGGATCLSVLTDSPYFQGRDEYVGYAKKVVPLPILRKDFMLDPYQILESRVLGADCILLIMAALSDKQAAELEDAAIELGLDVLAEVHDQRELERSMLLKTRLIGVNNRNLKTLKVDLAVGEDLLSRIPSDRLAVCESGVGSHEHVLRMKAAGAGAFLVGESLMLQPDVAAATRALLGN